MSKGIKTFNSSRARAGHSEALNYFPHHPQHQNVFSKKEHWALVSKQKVKLCVNKTWYIKKEEKRGREKGGRRQRKSGKWQKERREEKEREDTTQGLSRAILSWESQMIPRTLWVEEESFQNVYKTSEPASEVLVITTLSKKSRAWRHTLVIAALKMLRQEDAEAGWLASPSSLLEE